MPKLLIPPPYRGPTQGEPEIEVAGETVLACIEAAEARYPGFRAQVIAPSGDLHRFVRLFVNGEALASDPLARRLDPGDQVGILAAIAGGQGRGPQGEP